MSTPTQTRQWILSNPPSADPILSGDNATFKLTTTNLPSIGPNQVLLKTLYFSNDPAQRGWIQKGMDPERLYTAPVQQGEVMRSYAIAEVLQSNSETLKVGTMVMGSLGWTEYTVVDAKELRPLQIDPSSGLRPTHFIGSLGGPGLTAWYGLVDIARTTGDDAVVVSGAAGATGSMVVQIAKHILGCKKVIGIAGGAKKCEYVKGLGADECVDYKSETFREDLKRATEGFVEVYFDNVGGEILEAMLGRVKRNGRIAACGAVATYNSMNESGVKNWFEIITNRIEVKGFIVTDAIEAGRGAEMVGKLVQGVKEGKIKIGPETETVVPTKFEDVPQTWTMLFKGGNTGKLVTQLQ